MNFNENDLWKDKTELRNLKLSKLLSAKVLLKLEFDTKDQVLFISVLTTIESDASRMIQALSGQAFIFLGAKSDIPPGREQKARHIFS